MRTRRHYATTGARIHLDTSAEFSAPVKTFDHDPASGAQASGESSRALMGAIVESELDKTHFIADIAGTAPIERIDLHDGLECLETLRPWRQDGPSHRLRIVYEGAAARGRSRTVMWDGRITIDGNAIERAVILNNWNLDRGIREQRANGLSWSAVTTGNYGAIDLWLQKPAAGHVRLDTPFCTAELDLGSWDGAEQHLDCGGLDCGIRLYTLPDVMHETALRFSREITTPAGKERRLYLRIQQEDGHRAWSSPIYIMRK
jgi:hypothetical protein